ncbi:MAG: SPOR domain-containing protein [Bacteroidales bacterium]|nr:SPOR domain-containing protein [Bacteroidales bacterium]
MKRLFYFLMLLMVFTACHTTEENFKASYDMAKERTRENQGGAFYDKAQADRMRPTEIINGDSVRLIRSYFNVVDDKYEDTKKFGVVVAEFDQVINARSYRDRLKKNEGFESYIVYTNKEKKYCVIAQAYDNKGAAAVFIRNIGQYMKMKVLVPRPYILQRL